MQDLTTIKDYHRENPTNLSLQYILQRSKPSQSTEKEEREAGRRREKTHREAECDWPPVAPVTGGGGGGRQSEQAKR